MQQQRQVLVKGCLGGRVLGVAAVPPPWLLLLLLLLQRVGWVGPTISAALPHHPVNGHGPNSSSSSSRPGQTLVMRLEAASTSIPLAPPNPACGCQLPAGATEEQPLLGAV
jgi:hypothetical protein